LREDCLLTKLTKLTNMMTISDDGARTSMNVPNLRSKPKKGVMRPVSTKFARTTTKYGSQAAAVKTAKLLASGYSDARLQADQSGNPFLMTVIVEPYSTKPLIRIDKVGEKPLDDLDVALAEAKRRGAARAADILNGDDMLSADAFAKEMGATRETVHKKRRRHEVLGLEGPKRGVRFPKWQLSDSGELLPKLPALFEALGGHPWTVYRFLLQRHPELDGISALDALRRGRIKDAIAVAETIGTGSFT
jgi:hypothetical protein